MSEPTPTAPPTGGQPLAHDFDGIRELDNDPPLWFHLLFWATVVFSGVYLLHYHFGPGKVGAEAWKRDDVALQELKAAGHGGGPLTEADLRGLSTNPARIAAGKALFTTAACAACHGPEGLGVVGPNLRDRYWIHGPSMTAIVDVIANGANKNTMPANKDRLSADDMNNLAIYIVALNRAGLKDGKAIDPAREKDDPITY